MAIIQCKYCGAEISDKAKKCVKCNKPLKSNKKYIICTLVVAVVAIIILITSSIIKANKAKQEAVRQLQIEEKLEEFDKYYDKADYDLMRECVSDLAVLQYDTSKLMEIIEYDEKNYSKAVKYYNAIRETQNILKQKKYTSIKKVFKDFQAECKAFDEIEINIDSKVGKWVSELRKSSDYIAFEAVVMSDSYIENIEDNSFTDWIPADMLATTIEPLTKYDFPIKIK